MISIRKNLLILISAVFIIGTIITSIVVLDSAHEESSEIFDGNMMQIAQVLSKANSGVIKSNRDSLHNEEEVLIQIWSKSGQLNYSSHPKIEFQKQGHTGYGEVEFNKHTWRYYVLNTEENSIQIAQPYWIRNTLILEMGLTFIIPILLQLPIMLLLIWWSISKGTKPITDISEEIKYRETLDLSPMNNQDIPIEIVPIVDELNNLFKRLDRSIHIQKNFTANAAHELKTPLTAIKLYADMLQRNTDSTKREALLSKLQSSIERASHLIEQMLILSRQETDEFEKYKSSINLCDVVQKSILSHTVLIDNKNIQCDFVTKNDQSIVFGNSDYLEIMVDNLLVNAIYYTPNDGKILMMVDNDDSHIILSVTDNGIGIPNHEKENIFKRFYRILGNDIIGSGLGLSIVKDIADAHNATISVYDGPNGQGTTFKIIFASYGMVKSSRIGGK